MFDRLSLLLSFDPTDSVQNPDHLFEYKFNNTMTLHPTQSLDPFYLSRLYFKKAKLGK